MRLSRSLLAILLLGLVMALPRLGLSQTTSPYTVIVPVTDTSAIQRTQAFSTALGQVLARISGGQDLRGKQGYDDALQNAGGIVKQFQYQRGDSAQQGMSLSVTFDQGAVQRLITAMGTAPAGVKPPLLLVVRGSDGKLLAKDDLAALDSAVSKHGYRSSYADPSQMPDINKLKAADPAAMAAISRLYQTGLVLLGDLHNGNADWTLVSGGQSQHWTASGSTDDELFADAGAAATSRLGQALNVVGTSVVDGKFWISGLHSAQDYANALAVLRADPAVQKVNTLGGQDDGVLLAVKANMPLDGLAANLAAGGRLMQDASAHDGADASLRWLH